jgi:hypothetical protein
MAGWLGPYGMLVESRCLLRGLRHRHLGKWTECLLPRFLASLHCSNSLNPEANQDFGMGQIGLMDDWRSLAATH